MTAGSRVSEWARSREVVTRVLGWVQELCGDSLQPNWHEGLHACTLNKCMATLACHATCILALTVERTWAPKVRPDNSWDACGRWLHECAAILNHSQTATSTEGSGICKWTSRYQTCIAWAGSSYSTKTLPTPGWPGSGILMDLTVPHLAHSPWMSSLISSISALSCRSSWLTMFIKTNTFVAADTNTQAQTIEFSLKISQRSCLDFFNGNSMVVSWSATNG